MRTSSQTRPTGRSGCVGVELGQRGAQRVERGVDTLDVESTPGDVERAHGRRELQQLGVDLGDLMTQLLIVSGGLREPSTSRLWADRIDTAVREELTAVDISAASSVIELRPIGHAIIDAMLTGFAATALESAFELWRRPTGSLP